MISLLKFVFIDEKLMFVFLVNFGFEYMIWFFDLMGVMICVVVL